MTQNPWQELHKRRERMFSDTPKGMAMGDQIVDGEYRDAPKEFPCITPGCIGFAFYKATIGAMKCTRCGKLYHTNGQEV